VVNVVGLLLPGGQSVYGLVKKFLRVLCGCPRCHDLVVVTWFPKPVYPDGDPLTVKVSVGVGVDVNSLHDERVVFLNDIQPVRVAVSLDRVRGCMIMMRMEGVDTVHVI
jgi:hypothetical protein